MVLSIGEILTDMIGSVKAGITNYERYAGGAPFNVACAVKKFGGKSGFIGSVGDDIIGRWLCEFAAQKNFDYLDIEKQKANNTTLAFVELSEEGERSFCFYRKNTADYILDKDYTEAVKQSDIVHVGSLMLSEASGIASAERIFDCAEKCGKRISFDMNYREDLFSSADVFIPFIERAHIVKLSEDELVMLGGENLERAALKIAAKDKLLAVTLGSKGSAYCYNGQYKVVESIKIKPVDTTGAGDAFYAGLLTKLCCAEYTEQSLFNAFKFANICGALTATSKGAIDALPTLETIENYLVNGHGIKA